MPLRYGKVSYFGLFYIVKMQDKFSIFVGLARCAILRDVLEEVRYLNDDN